MSGRTGAGAAPSSAIQPVSFEQIRGALSKDGIAGLNFSAWNDWRTAMDSHFAAVLTELTHFANGLDDGVPAGFVGGQPPSAWGGYDYRKLTKAVQWMEAQRSLWLSRLQKLDQLLQAQDAGAASPAAKPPKTSRRKGPSR